MGDYAVTDAPSCVYEGGGLQPGEFHVDCMFQVFAWYGIASMLLTTSRRRRNLPRCILMHCTASYNLA